MPAGGQGGEFWAAGVAQAEHLGGLVESFTGGIVHRFAQNLVATDAIDPDKILARFSYAHPQYSLAASTAQLRGEELQGRQHSYFCGAYWANGFHEDGVVSALDALEHFRQDLTGSAQYANEERYLLRAG